MKLRLSPRLYRFYRANVALMLIASRPQSDAQSDRPCVAALTELTLSYGILHHCRLEICNIEIHDRNEPQRLGVSWLG